MDNSSDYLLSQYFRMLPDALLNFQFIEVSLRMYIVICHEIISKRVSTQIPLNYRYENLGKDGLGKLLGKFKIYNNNVALIGKLGKLISDRNYCAHEGYVLSYEQQKDSIYLSNELEKLEDIVKRAKECMQLLAVELKQVGEINKSLSI